MYLYLKSHPCPFLYGKSEFPGYSLQKLWSIWFETSSHKYAQMHCIYCSETTILLLQNCFRQWNRHFFPLMSGTRNSKEKGSSWNSAGKQLFQWRMQGEKLGASLASEMTYNYEPLCPVRRIWRQKWGPQPTLFLLSKVRNCEWCTFPAIKNESWKMRPWKNISFKSIVFLKWIWSKLLKSEVTDGLIFLR